MTREELKEHCLKQIENCEMWVRIFETNRGETPHDRLYEEHKLILELLEQEPRWIPVSERLPEDEVEVLVTREFPDGRGGTMRVLEIASYGAGCWITNDFRRYPTEEIIAWMPLPKPYNLQESEE